MLIGIVLRYGIVVVLRENGEMNFVHDPTVVGLYLCGYYSATRDSDNILSLETKEVVIIKLGTQ